MESTNKAAANKTAENRAGANEANLKRTNIVLIGFMGCGKTTVGRRVAASMGLDFYDTDEYLAKSEKMPVSQIAAKKGAAYFEGAQRFAVMNLCENVSCLISTGGNTVADEKNRELLKKTGFLIWLKASAKTVFKNINSSRNKRPELSGATEEEIARMLADREPWYNCCDAVVEVDGRDMDEIVGEVLRRAEELRRGAE